MPTTVLTHDSLPFMILAFGMAAGVALLFTIFLSVTAVGSLRALGNGAPTTATRCSSTYPPVCTTHDVRQAAQQRLAVALVLAILAVGLWCVGIRDRVVLLENDTVRITWGSSFLPITLHTWNAADLSAFTITQEQRFTVTKIVGTSVNRMSRAPDRWRLTALYADRTVQLGTYESEKAALAAKSALLLTAK